MELAVLTLAAAAALAAIGHRTPARTAGYLDPWGGWLIRNRKPQL